MSIKEHAHIILDLQRRFRTIMEDPTHTAADEIQLGIELFGFLSKNPLSFRLTTIRKIISRQISYFEQKYKHDGIWDSLGDQPDPLDPMNQLFYYMIDIQVHLLELECHEKIESVCDPVGESNA